MQDTATPSDAGRREEVAIIIPLFNGGAYITETIKSIQAQTHTKWHLIVVDDGSTDHGPRLVRDYADPRVSLHMKPHTGIAGTRNHGITELPASVDFVVFLDQDDVWHPTFLATTLDALRNNPGGSAAFALAETVDSQGRPFAHGNFQGFMQGRRELRGRALVKVPPTTPVTLEHVFFVNHIYPPSALVIRRSALEAVGGEFDSSFEVADDWDMVARLSRHGAIHPVNEILVGYRRHSANASSHSRRNVRETRAVWAKTFFSKRNDRETRGKLHRIWRAYQHEKSREKWQLSVSDATGGRPKMAAIHALDALAHLLLLFPIPTWYRPRG